MKTLPERIALVLLVVNVVGAVLAVILDLGARLVIGEVQTGDVGVNVLWKGSAISAPPPPFVALIIGLLLVPRTGKVRVAGLVLFILTGIVMTIGVIGEFAEGTSFSGGKQVVFVIFSAALGLLAAALALTSIRELVVRRREPDEHAF